MTDTTVKKDESREVLIEGQYADKLAKLHKGLSDTQKQQQELLIAAQQLRAGIAAIIGCYVGDDEVATNYNLDNAILTIDKKPKEDKKSGL